MPGGFYYIRTFQTEIEKARAEILQTILVTFWVIEFQEKLLLRFTDLYHRKPFKKKCF
jgi:hypothetical protein